MPLPDVDAFAAYGGPLRNYAPVVDPTTDEDAQSRNRYAANVAMMTHTAVRAMCSFVGADAAPPTWPDGFAHDALWGSAPNVKPTATRVVKGVWDLEWPAAVSTELSTIPLEYGGGKTHTLNFRRAYAMVESADGSLKIATAKVIAPNKVRVYGYAAPPNAAFASDDLAGQIITVWVF